MSPYLSEKIRNLSFFSILLVVLLHSQMISISTGYALWIQYFVTGELTRIAVPVFFAISGYLFFQNFSSPIKDFFENKIKKRVRTVLIPYLFWSVLGLLSLYLMQIILPNSSFFSKKIISEYNFHEILYAIFINPVGTYQLWFLRDLFVIVLLSPIIYIGIKYIKIFFVLLLFPFWILGIQYFIQIESVFFFSLGAYIALVHKDLLEKKCAKKGIAIFQFCMWLLYCCVLTEYRYEYYCHCLGILWGIGSIWCLYDVLYHFIRGSFLLKNLAGYSFFIYVAHEPLLTVVKKILLYMGHSSIWILLVYFIAPVITISICIIIGRMLRGYFPKFYAFISGGR